MSICKGGDLFCAYRSDIGGEFDIIGFETYHDMVEFCDFNTAYMPYETRLYSLKDAKEIFEGVI
jgi:hypothetical protein